MAFIYLKVANAIFVISWVLSFDQYVKVMYGQRVRTPFFIAIRYNKSVLTIILFEYIQ